MDIPSEKKQVRAKRPQGLGRGLSALLGDDVRAATAPSIKPTTSNLNVQEIAIDLLIPNADQPRRHFDEDALLDLSQSIQVKGVLQPILVRPLASDPGIFEIVAGERRWRAAQKARLHQVPVIIKELDDGETLTLALIENIQRADLSPIEEARAFRQLSDDLGHSQDALAEIVGKSRSHIANLLRLLTLPEKVQTLVNEGALTMGHARALINAENPEKLAQSIIEKGLSVRQVEALAKEHRQEGARAGGRTSKPAKTADTIALEQDLTNAMGLKVSVDHKGDSGGAVIIRYQSLEQLDEICQRLCREAGF